MAADLTLYVLAHPEHAALVLKSKPGSGFDTFDTSLLEEVSFEAEATSAALETTRARALATLENVEGEYMGKPISSLPVGLRPYAMAQWALVAPGEQAGSDDESPLWPRAGTAFVLETNIRQAILEHAMRNLGNVEALRTLIDANLGRVAVLLEV